MKRNKIIATFLALFFVACTLFGVKLSVGAQEVISVSANSALLADAYSGKVVYAKNENERLQIASMVKIMTLNLIFDEIEKGNLTYDQEIAVSENASSMGGSQAFLDARCSYKTEELIKSIIVASANDSCVAMAEHISGDVESFVALMNDTAQKWGMENTCFVNCTGLPAPGQYSCANDVMIMLKKLIEHERFFEFSGILMMDFSHPSGRITQLTNTNKLVKFYEGCDGGKTGYTSEARSCLGATAKRGETRLICVVIGVENSKTRNAEVSKLFNYGFANYETKCFVNGGESVNLTAKVSNGTKESVEICAKTDLRAFCKKGELKNCEIKYEINDVNAPINEGDVVGKIKIIMSDEVIAECDLISKESVSISKFMDFVNDIIRNW